MLVDYSAIAAKFIKPADHTTPPRLLIYGHKKFGKTRLCATAPDVLILDPERGTRAERAEVWPIRKWSDLNEAYQALAHGVVSPSTKKPYQWVAVDATTRLANMALRHVVGADQGDDWDLEETPAKITQPQYGLANELFKGMVYNFTSLKQGVIFTAQERVEEAKDQDEFEEATEVYRVADVPRGCRATLNAEVDLIGRIYIERELKDVKVKLKDGSIETRERNVATRKLWIAPHAAYDTGLRTPRDNTPDFLTNPTIPAIVSLLSAK